MTPAKTAIAITEKVKTQQKMAIQPILKELLSSIDKQINIAAEDGKSSLTINKMELVVDGHQYSLIEKEVTKVLNNNGYIVDNTSALYYVVSWR